MALPPTTIHIKRKRTDEPVDFLRIDKKPRADLAIDFVFQRQPSSGSLPSNASPDIRRIKQFSSSSTPPLPSSASSTPIQQQDSFSPSIGSGGSGVATPARPDNGSSTTSSFAGNTPSTPGGSLRRFRIARTAIPTGPTTSAIRKRKTEPTVFREQRKRPRTPQTEDTPLFSDNVIKTPAPALESEVESRQKRPGRGARISTPVKTPVSKASPAPLRGITLESGEVLPWDVSSERLTAEMQAYTMQEIGRNLAQAEAERPKPKPASVIRHNTPSKFKPKKPAQRYAERHPESQSSGMDIDEYVDEEDLDDSEYIIDTYIRYPALSFETSGSPKNIGLLIIESQPDIDEFYREEDDSSEEEDEDDEDENAEDHYTADYPEDEVDSDDEFDRNAYNYRNHNASDNEEYDEDDEIEFSDGEDRDPWKGQPIWMRPAKAPVVDSDDD